MLRRLLLPLLLAVTACDGPVEPAAGPSLSGSWTVLTQEGYDISADLVQDGHRVTGTGRISAVPDIHFAVSGTNTRDGVVLTLRPAGHPEFEFRGTATVGSYNVPGTFNGWFFEDTEAIFSKRRS